MAHRTITSEKRSSYADASRGNLPRSMMRSSLPAPPSIPSDQFYDIIENANPLTIILKMECQGLGTRKIILKSWHAWNWKPWKETLATRYSKRHHACQTKHTAPRLLSQTHGPAPALIEAIFVLKAVLQRCPKGSCCILTRRRTSTARDGVRYKCQEKDLIPAAEDRLHADRQEENGAAPESPPQTVLCQFFSADVAVTWNCARAPAGEGRAAVCACWADKRSGKDLASMMETLMDQAECAVSSREQTAGLKFLTALVLPAITQGLPPLGPSQSEAAVLRHLLLAFLHVSFRKHRWFL